MEPPYCPKLALPDVAKELLPDMLVQPMDVLPDAVHELLASAALASSSDHSLPGLPAAIVALPAAVVALPAAIVALPAAIVGLSADGRTSAGTARGTASSGPST